LRGKIESNRIHNIPKSYGKDNALTIAQKYKIVKIWSHMTTDFRKEVFLEAKKAAAESLNDAFSSRNSNTKSSEMARLMHLYSFSGATHIVTQTRDSMVII
jgi:hypothetical protein